MIRRPPRSTLDRSSAASDVYKRRVFHRNASRRTFLILEPKHTQRTDADEKPCLSFFFVDQIDNVELEPFLLLFARETDRGAAFFVAQQGVKAVVMLGNKISGRVLAGRECGAVN